MTRNNMKLIFNDMILNMHNILFNLKITRYILKNGFNITKFIYLLHIITI